jgi:hypothetical protein
MLYGPEIPARAAGVHPRRQADPAKQQRRVVRRLLRDLVALAGPVVNDDLAGRSRKAPQRRPQRVLFRRADSLTDADLDRLIREIGAGRLMAALDRWTQPRFTVAAE